MLSQLPVELGLDVFDDGGRPALLYGSTIFDLSGNFVRSIQVPAPDFIAGSFMHIGSGPFAGKFAAFDPAASEIIVFSP
jgi:hypothetical protein